MRSSILGELLSDFLRHRIKFANELTAEIMKRQIVYLDSIPKVNLGNAFEEAFYQRNKADDATSEILRFITSGRSDILGESSLLKLFLWIAHLTSITLSTSSEWHEYSSSDRMLLASPKLLNQYFKEMLLWDIARALGIKYDVVECRALNSWDAPAIKYNLYIPFRMVNSVHRDSNDIYNKKIFSGFSGDKNKSLLSSFCAGDIDLKNISTAMWVYHLCSMELQQEFDWFICEWDKLLWRKPKNISCIANELYLNASAKSKKKWSDITESVNYRKESEVIRNEVISGRYYRNQNAKWERWTHNNFAETREWKEIPKDKRLTMLETGQIETGIIGTAERSPEERLDIILSRGGLEWLR